MEAVNTLPKVVVFQDDETALGYSYKTKVGQNVKVCSIDYDQDYFAKNKLKVIGDHPVEPGEIYYKHPYRVSTYVNSSKDDNYFLEEKIDFYKRVAVLLGAKSIATKVQQCTSEKITIDCNGEVSVLKINGGASLEVNTENQQKYKNALEIEESYNLQENFDLQKNIKELKDVIKKCNLSHETQILSLIDARDPSTSGTQLAERKVRSEVSSELNDTKKIAAKLFTPVFQINGNYKTKTETLHTINLEIEFKF